MDSGNLAGGVILSNSEEVVEQCSVEEFESEPKIEEMKSISAEAEARVTEVGKLPTEEAEKLGINNGIETTVVENDPSNGITPQESISQDENVNLEVDLLENNQDISLTLETASVGVENCSTVDECVAASIDNGSATVHSNTPSDPLQLPSECSSIVDSIEEEVSQELSNNNSSEEAAATNVDASEQKSDDANNEISSQVSQDIVNNCYCGKKRVLGSVELQCAGCYKWFHEKCVSISLGKVLPFMTYYTYFCKSCNPSGMETFSKKQPNFSQMCATAVANLTFQSRIKDNGSKAMFSKDKEIIPYIESNWELLTTMPRRVKQTWHSTVYKSMMKDNDVFLWDENKTEDSNSGYFPIFGLSNQDLSKIAPSYDSMARGGLQKQIQEMTQSGGFSGGKGRSAKRRFFGDGPLSAGGKKIKSDLVMPKLPPNGYPLEHPFNKDGYRYILAEPDPHAPFRQEFDESQDWAGKPIPGWLYRKLTPNNVLLALHDRAPQLKVSGDRLHVTGEKGYCMIRATHGISRGTWYFEINIEEMGEGSATRLGWSQGLGNLQAPLGYDKFSYSWRSRKGTKFHESRGYHYADEGYGQGDTLGFLIELPPTTDTVPLPPIHKDKPLVKFKSYLYYEEKDETQLELKNLKPLIGSKITFFKNGKSYGAAFENIYKGIYFPAASLYKNCTIAFNFGPDFKHPPDVPFKSMHEAALEALLEQLMTDLLFFTENKGKLRLDNIV